MPTSQGVRVRAGFTPTGPFYLNVDGKTLEWVGRKEDASIFLSLNVAGAVAVETLALPDVYEVLMEAA